MIIFDESGLRFEFSEQYWWVCKYDDNIVHKNVKINEHKAIDFIAIYKNSEVVLFEIKSFRNHQIENKERLKDSAEDLTTEIAQKVRDTIAACIGAARNQANETEKWKLLADLVANAKKTIKVVAWVEEDTNVVLEKRHKAELSTRNDKLKHKMKWLTTKTLFCNVNETLNYEGFSVKLLANQ